MSKEYISTPQLSDNIDNLSLMTYDLKKKVTTNNYLKYALIIIMILVTLYVLFKLYQGYIKKKSVQQFEEEKKESDDHAIIPYDYSFIENPSLFRDPILAAKAKNAAFASANPHKVPIKGIVDALKDAMDDDSTLQALIKKVKDRKVEIDTALNKGRDRLLMKDGVLTLKKLREQKGEDLFGKAQEEWVNVIALLSDVVEKNKKQNNPINFCAKAAINLKKYTGSGSVSKIKEVDKEISECSKFKNETKKVIQYMSSLEDTLEDYKESLTKFASPQMTESYYKWTQSMKKKLNNLLTSFKIEDPSDESSTPTKNDVDPSWEATATE